MTIGLLFVAMGFYNLYKMHRSLLYIEKRYKELESDDFNEINAPQIILMIPLLREAQILSQTIQGLSRLIYPIQKLKIVLVTTEREYEELDKKPAKNTIDVVQSELVGLEISEKFIHIHYPYTKGIKSDQLNYALNILEKDYPFLFNSNTYIGVYDADSITQPQTLQILAKEIQRDSTISIFQQPTLYLKNRYKFTYNYLARAFGWIQTSYAFSVENFNIISHVSGKSLKLIYAVGHGLFIKYDSLKSIGLFPTPIEDTRLGHTFSFLDYKFKLLPVFDLVEVTPRALLRIKQASVWFMGVNYFLKDFHIASSFGAKSYQRMIAMACYRFYRNIVWIVRAFMLLGVCIALLPYSRLMSFLVLMTYLYIPLLYLLSQTTNLSRLSAENISPPKLADFLCLLFVPLEYLNMSLGPLFGFAKRFIFQIKSEKILYPKTERI